MMQSLIAAPTPRAVTLRPPRRAVHRATLCAPQAPRAPRCAASGNGASVATAPDASVAVCAAMKALEKAKLPADGLAAALAGPTPDAPRRWRLVFTSSAAQVRDAVGGGRYFPITAVQSWEADAGRIVNGVYLGHVFALQFSGPCRLTNKRLEFDFDALTLKAFGAVGRFRLKPAGYALPDKGTKAAGALPFFLFAHADEHTVVARGRSGGVAVWARAEPSWLLTAGATQL